MRQLKIGKLNFNLEKLISFILGIIFSTCVTVLAETCQTTLSSSNVTYGDTTVQAETSGLFTQAGNLDSRVSTLEDKFGSLAANTVVVTDANKKLTTSSTIDTTELGYLNGVTSNIQTQINNKAAKSGYTANRAMVSDSSGNLAVSGTIDTTELGYLNGVTSNIQTQINNKAAKSGWTASRVMTTDGSGNLAVSGITTTKLGYLTDVTSNIQAQLNAKLASGNIYVRRQSGTASNGAITNLTIPSGYNNYSNVFVTTYYALNDAQYITIQFIDATKYHVYVRSPSGQINGAVSWVELWMK